MATMVERPMSALSDAPLLPQLRRRPSVVEVIDVDLFDEPSTSSARPTPRPRNMSRHDAIFVIDSDEEDFAEPAASSSTRPARRRQRLSSPPPPPTGEPSHIPPVPPVPRRYSGLLSFPAPRRLPPFPSPPVVRPMNQPFAFEANIRSSPPAAGPSALHPHPNRHRRVPPVEDRAEPQSHYRPSLGLGGALISINRARAEDRHETRRDRRRHLLHTNANTGVEPPGFLARAGNHMRQLFTRVHNHNLDDDDYPEMQAMLANELGLGFGEDRFDHPARGYALQELLRNRMRQRQQEMEYQSEYTHPGQPEPGFTFDFAPPEPSPAKPPKPAPIVIDLEEEDAPATGTSTRSAPASPTSSLNTLLVCARCLDPLVLGGGLVGEEGRQKKVWALRCGHMIEGKCLDIIGNPESEAPTMEDVEGAVDAETQTDWMGKGKGKAREDDNMELSALPELPENTMRSRLRSRAAPLVVPPVVSSASALASTSHALPPPVLGKRKRHSKPRIEATHEWKCPVAGCGRIHASVKVEGAWVPEPAAGVGKGKGKSKAGAAQEGGRGAIPVFV